MQRPRALALHLSALLLAGLIGSACCVRLPEIGLGGAVEPSTSAFLDLGPDADASAVESARAARFTLRWRVGDAEERRVEIRLALDAPSPGRTRALRLLALGGTTPGESVLLLGPERLPSYASLIDDGRVEARRQVVRYAMLFLDVARETGGYWQDLREAARGFVDARKAEIVSNLFSAIDLALAASDAMSDDAHMQRFLEGALEVDWQGRDLQPSRVRFPVRLGVGRVDLMRGVFECVPVTPGDDASFGVRAFEGQVGDCRFRLEYSGEVSGRPGAVRNGSDTWALLDPEGRLDTLPARIGALGRVVGVHGGLAVLRRVETPEDREERLVPAVVLRLVEDSSLEQAVLLHGSQIGFLGASDDATLSAWRYLPRGRAAGESTPPPWRHAVIVRQRGGPAEVVWESGAELGAGQVLLAPRGGRFAVVAARPTAESPAKLSVHAVRDGALVAVAELRAPPGVGMQLAGWTAADGFLVRLEDGALLQLQDGPGAAAVFEPLTRVGWDELPSGLHQDLPVDGHLLRRSLDSAVYAQRPAPEGRSLHRSGDPLFLYLDGHEAGGAPQVLRAAASDQGPAAAMPLPAGTEWHADSGWFVHHDPASGRLRAMHRSMPRLGWQIETVAEAFLLGVPIPVDGRAAGPWDSAPDPETAALVAVRDLRPSEPQPMFGLHLVSVECRVEAWFRGPDLDFSAYEPVEPLETGGLVNLEREGPLESAARQVVDALSLHLDPRGRLAVLGSSHLLLWTRHGPIGLRISAVQDPRSLGGDPEWLLGRFRAVRVDACRRYLAAAPGDAAWRVDFPGWPEPPEVVRWRPVSRDVRRSR